MALSNETIRGTPPDYYLDAMGKGKLLNELLNIPGAQSRTEYLAF